ncbi:uncharacterized protein GIQ15_05771 [Arthroderma uncinatum]|uniref:uncharacterized protein n=1 Tax=Arthroderma uncinatum TaxID=74035 RepID=UPI00144AC1ED|nr:uncharacterized protein GIQ15_05771 [Arthroderma uncinatum]KAF3480424.1 hypothetical protein GIQ15_05771 [Arthroderma uncinatum]
MQNPRDCGVPAAVMDYDPPGNVTVKYVGQLGVGLVATTNIERGDPILFERVIAVLERDESISATIYNIAILAQLENMGPWFKNYFYKLQKRHGDGTPDSLGAKFDLACIPCPASVTAGGKMIRVAGSWCSRTNHSCTPNAHQMLSRGLDDKAKEAYYVAVRATKVIRKGEEVTVAYDYVNMQPAARRQYMLARFGFVCRCHVCDRPTETIEKCFSALHEDIAAIQTRYFSSIDPVKFFQCIERIYLLHVGLDFLDIRGAQILEQAARFSAYHSDKGRAVGFLTLASPLYLFAEGVQGPNAVRATSWKDDPSLIPGYGTTTKGLSKESDFRKIGPLDAVGLAIACMQGIQEGQYLSLSYMADRRVGAHYGGVNSGMRGDADEEDAENRAKNLKELIKTLEEEKKHHDLERLEGSQLIANGNSSSTANKKKNGGKNKKKKKKKR